jgi:2-polyprenyl-6-methoxyphenol hydroxylase-like FAD-dependent oxidoreductase
MPKTTLITGASIAGLSSAFWLARAGWRVEVVERFDAFRTGGQNVEVGGARGRRTHGAHLPRA